MSYGLQTVVSDLVYTVYQYQKCKCKNNSTKTTGDTDLNYPEYGTVCV